MIDIAMLWFAVSFLYMATGIVIFLGYPELPHRIGMTFFLFGAAIFIILNRSVFIELHLGLTMWHMSVIILLVLAWLFGVMSVRGYLRLTRDL